MEWEFFLGCFDGGQGKHVMTTGGMTSEQLTSQSHVGHDDGRPPNTLPRVRPHKIDEQRFFANHHHKIIWRSVPFDADGLFDSKTKMLCTTRFVCLLSCFSVVASSTSSFATRGIAGVSRHSALFGVPRGGGLFGGKNDDKKYVL